MSRKKMPAYGPRRRRRSPLPALIILVLAVVSSLIIAGAWQLADPTPYDPGAFAKPPGSEEVPPDASSQGEESAPLASSSQPDAPPPEESQGPPAPSGDGSFTALVPQGEWLPSTYFDDALFVGDSITEGIKLYDVMSNAKVLASTGVNLSTIFTKEAEEVGGSKVSIVDAARLEDPGKIYVLMGVNSMLSGKEDFIAGYGRLVDALREQHPGAVIYVQSILPVTAAYEAGASAVTTNAKIDEYNAAILDMCQEKELYYLNIAEAFKDDTGALPSEASPRDGIHFGRSWYMKWFDYLRAHGAPEIK